MAVVVAEVDVVVADAEVVAAAAAPPSVVVESPVVEVDAAAAPSAKTPPSIPFVPMSCRRSKLMAMAFEVDVKERTNRAKTKANGRVVKDFILN